MPDVPAWRSLRWSMREGDLLLLAAARCPGFELFEEIVALVVYEDESREVFHVYFPDGFHAEFGIFHALDALDGALRQHGSRHASCRHR